MLLVTNEVPVLSKGLSFHRQPVCVGTVPV